MYFLKLNESDLSSCFKISLSTIMGGIKQRLTDECQTLVLVEDNRCLVHLLLFPPVCDVGWRDALLQEQVLLVFLHVYVFWRPAQLSTLHLAHLRGFNNDGGQTLLLVIVT